MIRFESFPTGQIKDPATRDGLAKLSRFAEDAAKLLATQSDLSAALLKMRAGLSVRPSTNIVQVVTPEQTPGNSGDFVQKAGDLMSGRLGVRINNTRYDGTSEGIGIENIGYTTYERADTWNSGVSYTKFARVGYSGFVWEALVASLAVTPVLGSATWEQIGRRIQPWIRGAWSNAITYVPGEVVLDTSVIWQAKENYTAANLNHAPAFGSAWWELIENHDGSTGPTYAAGDRVVFGGGIYVSQQATNLNHLPVLNTAWWIGSAPVTVGIQNNGFAAMGNGFGFCFGQAGEALNGTYPTAGQYGIPTSVDRTLVGSEPAVINRNPNSLGAKVAGDFTFKNRADPEYFTQMPLGPNSENRYNINARSTQFSSFPRSTVSAAPSATAWSYATNYIIGNTASFQGTTYTCTVAHGPASAFGSILPPNANYWDSPGEYCGWPTLLRVNRNATDISANQPYTVVLDMYNQTVDNEGLDTWLVWWATGLYKSNTQPLGAEGGIRYTQSDKSWQWHGNIVDGSKLACSIDMSITNDPAGGTGGGANTMVLNSGRFPMRMNPQDSFNFQSVGQRSGTNFVTAAAGGVVGNPFNNTANPYPVSFWSVWIDGTHQKIALYNP